MKNTALFRRGSIIYTFHLVLATEITESQVVVRDWNGANHIFEIQFPVCPTNSPSHIPSLFPSFVPTIQSASPSVTPSSSICSITSFTGSTYYFTVISFPGTCWKVDLFDGGTLEVDYSHESCSSSGFSGGTVFGDYMGLDELENTVTFSDGKTHYNFQIIQSGIGTSPGVDFKNMNTDTNTYEFDVLLPSCTTLSKT